MGAGHGSVTTAQRTTGSDLDIVVVLPDGDPAAPHRSSRYWRKWPVELFVHDAASLIHFLDKDLPVRRPTLHRMVATGVSLTGDSLGAARVQADCAKILARGPSPLTAVERAWDATSRHWHHLGGGESTHPTMMYPPPSRGTNRTTCWRRCRPCLIGVPRGRRVGEFTAQR